MFGIHSLSQSFIIDHLQINVFPFVQILANLKLKYSKQHLYFSKDFKSTLEDDTFIAISQSPTIQLSRSSRFFNRLKTLYFEDCFDTVLAVLWKTTYSIFTKWRWIYLKVVNTCLDAASPTLQLESSFGFKPQGTSKGFSSF